MPAVEDHRVADHSDQHAAGPGDQFAGEGHLLVFILEFIEFDLDQLVLGKPLIGCPDDSP